MMRRILTVTPLEKYRVTVEFDNGVSATVDLSDLAGRGVFAIWEEPGGFETVHIGSSGELVWGQQVDLCPDAVYLRATNSRPEDVFPALRESTRA